MVNYDGDVTKKLEDHLYSLNLETKFDDNAMFVLNKRYLKKDDDGNVIEKPKDMLIRVASNIAYADSFYDRDSNLEKTAEEFYRTMNDLDFLPNSPTLMNAGRDLQQLSACFVLPIEDSIESIFTTAKNAVLVHKSGGGTGFSFSRLRPKNDIVKTTHGIASGPPSFVKVFNVYTDVIRQGGTRRGANMGVLSVHHPDIMDFIYAKRELDDKNKDIIKTLKRYKEEQGITDNGEIKKLEQKIEKLLIERTQLENFNLSVAVTDKFMDAVRNDLEYGLIHPVTNKIVKKLKARDVFKEIVNGAWKKGEPGIIFIDEMNRYNPTPNLGEYEATNPCGEQVLLPYESCNLGSINLANMINEDDKKLDEEKLKKIVRIATHFLDNVIDMNNYPLPEIEVMTKGNRKIGLGMMGFADLLLQLGIQYNGREGLDMAEHIASIIDEESKSMSLELAKKRGTFPNIRDSVYDIKSNNYERLPARLKRLESLEFRNATTTTIAPTGTISKIANNASSGIEPLFSLAFTYEDADKNKRHYVCDYLITYLERKNVKNLENILDEVKKGKSLQDIKNVPDDVKRTFVTAHDIDAEWHIRMQAAFQKYVDNAISKTINFPDNASVNDMAEAYLLAYDLKCKGLTVYRDKSRDEQILTKGIEEKYYVKPTKRPVELEGKTIKKKTGCGSLFVTINHDKKGDPKEVFNTMGKAGGCVSSQSEAIGRLISYSLKLGADPKDIIDQLIDTRCDKPYIPYQLAPPSQRNLSCSDAIAKAFADYLKIDLNGSKIITKEDSKIDEENLEEKSSRNIPGACLKCGSSLVYEEGCTNGKCSNPICDYAACN